jgi:two-component system NtrC family sensor kinase
MDIVESTLELMQHEIKVNDVHVVRKFVADMPRTSADFHLIQQVFLNIISNAVQAMKAQDRPGTLTVKSECDDRAMRIHVGDTGPGIPRDNYQKIFEPFFTTKEEGKGTGLGLSLCYEIIQDHGGDIYVSSEPGKGTCFVVELPIVAQDPVMQSDPAEPATD